MTPLSTPNRTRTAAVLLAALLLLLGACAGGGDETSSSDSGGAVSGLSPEAEAPVEVGGDAFADADGRGVVTDEAADGLSTGSVGGSTAGSAGAPLVPPGRAVVSTGTVALRDDDVARARAEVQQVVDELRGEVSDERTGTDGEGTVVRSRIVVRVPVASFDEAMVRLSGIGTLDRATRSTEDVTTQVVDVAARVRAQTKSLERVEALLAEADDLREVIAVESQLTRRQADLDALVAQQRYLADVTALSTITVSVERPLGEEPAIVDDEGFLAGLEAGWDALEDAAVASMTVLGAVLPFAVVGALVGVPLLLVARRRRPAQTG